MPGHEKEQSLAVGSSAGLQIVLYTVAYVASKQAGMPKRGKSLDFGRDNEIGARAFHAMWLINDRP